MDGPPGDVAAHRHVVAGLIVRSACPLPGLPVEGFHDGDVVVRVVDRLQGDRAGWLDAPLDGPGKVALRADGGEIEAANAGMTGDQLAVAVRAAVPFAAALQAKVTLHAAAFALPGGMAAVVGGGGAGKSTLAAALRSEGVVVVADDLVPCRLKVGRVAVPAPPEASGRHGLARLLGIFFLVREAGLDEPQLKPLGGRGCFKRLIRHGFGEIAVAAAWSSQVDVYHRIADQVPAFELTVPDDAGRVGEVAHWFLSVCRRELE